MARETSESALAAEKEKKAAAAASVSAAILLTVLKLGVGLATNSLGVLSEALHSGLDLLAAGMTYFAVRVAAFPPDKGHPYGHGKIENLSALVETLLLLVTCVWIIREAVDRLFFAPVAVKPSVAAVLVMAVSIIVDYSRSRMLLRVAKKHRSQALEADALHFSTDMLSSAVVLAGLGMLFLAEFLPEPPLRAWLEKGDALAALGVSVIILRISYSLGKRAVNVLLDAGDTALSGEIYGALRSLPGVLAIEDLRLRHSGPDLFVDIDLVVGGGLLLEEADHIRAEVEKAVRAIAEYASVSIVLVPQETERGDHIQRLRGLAAAHGLVTHAVEVLDLASPHTGHRHVLVEMHVEFPASMSLKEAHDKVSGFERSFCETRENVIIVTHIEPRGERGEEKIVTPPDAAHIKEIVRQAVMAKSDVWEPHNVLVRTFGDGRGVSFHCRMAPQVTVGESHAVAARLQKSLHQALPEIERITVHMEPAAEEEGDERPISAAVGGDSKMP